jgi:hypothetical protein
MATDPPTAGAAMVRHTRPCARSEHPRDGSRERATLPKGPRGRGRGSRRCSWHDLKRPAVPLASVPWPDGPRVTLSRTATVEKKGQGGIQGLVEPSDPVGIDSPISRGVASESDAGTAGAGAIRMRFKSISSWLTRRDPGLVTAPTDPPRSVRRPAERRVAQVPKAETVRPRRALISEAGTRRRGRGPLGTKP